MKENVRTKHQDHLEKVEGLFSGLRALLVGQESALSRLIIAALSTRPQTIQRRDGKEELASPSVISSCAHVRMIGPPGIGKTHLASSLAAMLDCDFNRIECTPDKQPSDIIGGSILTDGGTRSMFMRGPLLNANVILADEITNATPRTQRSLLAGLSEDYIWVSTINGASEESKNKMSLRVPFFFMATQNPLSELGTYPMPRAILDRFSMTLNFRHLYLPELIELQKKNEEMIGFSGASQRIERQSFIALREFIFTEMKVPLETAYFISVVTRLLDPSARDENEPAFRRLYDEIWSQRFDVQNRKLVKLKSNDKLEGTMTYRLSDLIQDVLIERAVLFLRYLGKALAFTKTDDKGGMREYVVPSDIFKLYTDVMSHRIGLTNVGENLGADYWIIDEIVRFVKDSVKDAHWFFAQLPKTARKIAGDVNEKSD